MPPSRDRLLAELASLRPEPDGSEAHDRFLGFLRATEDPFARSNPVGHVTASAIIARDGGDAVLLRYHRKLDRWLQPGGHTEPSDPTAFAAALREAREETGIEDFEAPLGESLLDVDVHEIPAWKDEPPHLHFDVRFLLLAPARSRASRRHRTRWFSSEAVLAEGEPSLSRAVRRARERLAGKT